MTRTTAPVADPSSAASNASHPLHSLHARHAAPRQQPARSGAPAAAADQPGALPTATRQLVEIWHPWVSRYWPSTASEETTFVTTLRSLSGDAGSSRDFDRRDVTALVTALRCGLTADELLSRARGLRPARLLAAHTHLELARAAAEQAWRSIVAAPTSTSLAHFGPLAATLLPVIVSHLEAIDRRTPRDLERGILTADGEISRTTASVLLLEERLDACVAPSDRGRAIGSLLYDAYGDGAWALGTFLSPRVGTLVPLRVASLLGEDTPGRLRQAS